MRTLWTKIGLGALGVFLVGMLLLTVVDDAKSTVRGAFSRLQDLHHSTSDLQADIPFILSGHRLGTVNHMSIRRGAAHDMARFTLTVALDPGADRSSLADCNLVPVDGDHFDIERGFRCASSSEEGWADIGSVIFESTGVERPILAAGSVEAQLHKGHAFSADADMKGPFTLTASGDRGELVHLKADSTGAILRVNDKNGRAVVRLQADRNGLSLVVDSAAAH